MKSTVAKISLVASVCALAACSSVTVTTDYDHAALFNHYKTYALEPAAHGQVLSPASEQALGDTVRAEFALRGITETSASKADLAVVRHVFREHKTSVQQYTDWGYGYHGAGYHGAWPYRYGYYDMWAGAPRTYVDVKEFTEGTLVLDVVDAKTKKLVFRGTAVAVVGSPEANADKIREAVKKMADAVPARPAAH